MGLTGIQIFKYLPKTNCGDCKFPTCLAFAMRLAAAQVRLDACPHVSEEAKKVLTEVSAPPIRLVKLGMGDRTIELGDETVLFRHEKKFNHPSALALLIADNLTDQEIEQKIQQVNNSVMERVGQKLRVELICLQERSADPARFAQVAKKIVASSEAGLILSSFKPEMIKAALAETAARNPLIYAATEENYSQMTALAKEYKLPLAVFSDKGLEALSSLAEKVAAEGVEDLVLDSGARSSGRMLSDLTQIRRAAIKKKFKPLGYPTIIFPGEGGGDALMEAARAGIGIMKYASLIVLNSIEKEVLLPLYTLRQNIFTDPQQPMQVAENLYKVGEPNQDSPLLITTNFSLTYFIVLGEIENSKVPSWLLVADSEGLSVLTAWAADKFNAPKIAKLVKKQNVEEIVKHRKLIIPGYVSILSGEIEEELPGWKVLVGPREAANIPKYLRDMTSSAAL
ncbi:MAG: acetyl-CoA decarbonylase/synthase complex subunit gamma [bacterium]|nr:acetyl-CoA decarbonylase/synthase complex subunit gamma [bacterium]